MKCLDRCPITKLDFYRTLSFRDRESVKVFYNNSAILPLAFVEHHTEIHSPYLPKIDIVLQFQLVNFPVFCLCFSFFDSVQGTLPPLPTIATDLAEVVTQNGNFSEYITISA